MGIEDAMDWITAVKGAAADPALTGRRRRITRIGAPVPPEPSRSTVATIKNASAAEPTKGDD